jgi:hypothetical protein
MLHLCPKLYAAEVKVTKAMPALALFVSLALAAGCATVHTKVASFEEPIPVASQAIEPHLELWVESGSPISAKQEAEAAQDARAALADVISAHDLVPHAQGAGDPLLIVREQSVARTDSRRTDQKVAAAGIVVGAALVVVAAVAIVVAGGSSGGKLSGGHFSGGGGHLQGASAHLGGAALGGHLAAHAFGAGVRAIPVHAAGVGSGVASSFSHQAPRTSFTHGGLSWNRAPVRSRYSWSAAATVGDLAVDLVDPAIELAIELNYADERAAFAEADREARFAEEGPEEDLPAPPPPPELLLPELPPMKLEGRGFFDGDDTILALDLYDRESGALLFSNVVRGNIDPRNREDVDDLFIRALAKASWAQDK